MKTKKEVFYAWPKKVGDDLSERSVFYDILKYHRTHFLSDYRK